MTQKIFFVVSLLPALLGLLYAELIIKFYGLDGYGEFVYLMSIMGVLSAFSVVPVQEGELRSSSNKSVYCINAPTLIVSSVVSFIMAASFLNNLLFCFLISLLVSQQYLKNSLEELLTADSNLVAPIYEKVFSFFIRVLALAACVVFLPENFIEILLLVMTFELFIVSFFYYIQGSQRVEKLKFSFGLPSLDKKYTVGQYSGRVAKSLSQNLDNLVVNYLFSAESLGIYSAIKKLSNVIILLTNPLFSIFHQKSQDAIARKSKDFQKMIAKSMAVISIVGVLYAYAVFALGGVIPLDLLTQAANYKVIFIIMSIGAIFRANLWWPRYVSIYVNPWKSLQATFATTIIMALMMWFLSGIIDMYAMPISYTTSYLLVFGFWIYQLVKIQHEKY